MMSRSGATPSRVRALVFVALLPSCLSLLFLHQWRVARAERGDIAATLLAVEARSRGREARRGALDGRIEASLRALAKDIAAMRRNGSFVAADPAIDSHSVSLSSEAGEDEDRSIVEQDGESGLPPLRPLPGGKDVEQVLHELSLVDLLRDAGFNPEKTWLTPQEFGRGHAELARAKGRMEVLRSEVKLRVIEGMEELRATGAYVEYAPWQRYETLPGVLTAAEEIEGGGTRMFYYYPEDFPEIYAKQAERREVAERALRRVGALIATSRGGKLESPEDGK